LEDCFLEEWFSLVFLQKLMELGKIFWKEKMGQTKKKWVFG